MKVRKSFLFIMVALAVALVISYSRTPHSYVDQLVRIQARQELAPVDQRILDEPVEVQAYLLDYVGDRELVLKAWIALSKYPEMSRTILLEYGAQPEFKAILKTYGEAVIPVIHYFRENNVFSVVIADYGKRKLEDTKELAASIWNRLTGKGPPTPVAADQRETTLLGPNERGWYAIGLIKNEGHDLLGQFVVAPDKTVKWNQTDRLVKAVSSLLTSGIRTLETKFDLGDLTAGDYFWAGLDVALIAAPLKLLRAGKLVSPSGKVVTGTGKELSLATRTKLFAPRLVAESKALQTLGKYGAIAATAYIVVTHPSLISALLAEVADFFGLNFLAVQFVGWFLIVWLVLYPFSWLLKVLAKVILLGFSSIERSRRKSTVPAI